MTKYLATTEALLVKAKMQLQTYVIRANGKGEGRGLTTTAGNLKAANQALGVVSNMLVDVTYDESKPNKKDSIFSENFFEAPESLVKEHPKSRALDLTNDYLNTRGFDRPDDFLTIKPTPASEMNSKEMQARDIDEFFAEADFKQETIKKSIEELQALKSSIDAAIKKNNVTESGTFGRKSESYEVLHDIKTNIDQEIKRYESQAKEVEKAVRKRVKNDYSLVEDARKNQVQWQISQAQNLNLATELTNTKDDFNRLQKEYAQNQKLLKAAQESKEDLAIKLSDTQKKLKQSEKKAAQVEKTQGSRDYYKTQLEVGVSQIQSLERERQSLQSQLTTKAGVEDTNVHIKEQINNMEEVTQAIVKASQEALKQNVNLKDENEKLKEENAKLKLENTALKSQLKAAQETIANMFRYFTSAVSKVLGFETAKTTGDTVAKDNGKLTEVKDVILKAQEEYPTIEKLEDQLANTKKDNADLQSKLEESNKNLQDMILQQKQKVEEKLEHKDKNIFNKILGRGN